MSNINVNTITPLAGTSGTVSVSGSLLVSGNITAQGNLTFGNQDTDSVAFGAEISSSVVPDANNLYELGSASKTWKTIYAATGSFNHIVSSGSGADATVILTSASIAYLEIGSGNNPAVGSHIIPNANNTFDLGVLGLQWRHLYIDGKADIDTITNVSGAAPANYNVEVSASLVPATNTIWDLGTTAKEWKDLYIDGKAFIDTLANQTNDVLVSASLTPNADATYAFGSTAKQWKHIAAQSASFSHKIGIGLTSNPIEALDVIGNISSSGHLSSSNVGAALHITSPTASFGTTPSNTTNTAGNVIYAHGNISASGATMAATASFGAPTTVTTNIAGTPLYVHGNASASGLVSAQTMSIANGATPSGMQLSIVGNASASGHISASNIGGASIIGTNITASTNISTSLATSKATFSSASVTYRLGVGTSANPAEALEVVGNISASGDVEASSLTLPLTEGTSQDLATSTQYTVNGSKVKVKAITAAQIDDGAFASFTLLNSSIAADSVVIGNFVGNCAANISSSIITVAVTSSNSASVFIHNETDGNIAADTAFTATFVIL